MTEMRWFSWYEETMCYPKDVFGGQPYPCIKTHRVLQYKNEEGEWVDVPEVTGEKEDV